MGLDVALKALAGLLKSRENLYFVIVGSGPLEARLRSLAQALGVAEKVWFLGRVEENTLRRCYEAADLFLLPTTDLECFGLIVLEALGFGLPIVSTDAGAIPELMEPILPECIVPAGSVKDMREKVDAWIRGAMTAPDADEMIQYVEKRFSKEVITPQILSFVLS